MVLIRRQPGTWHEPESSSFDNEKELQALVKLSPTLLPGNDELAVVDEMWLPGIGFADLVGVGADGRIVIVECKLRANPEIRREVVGQVLAYAGAIWRMSYDQFASAFATRAGTNLYDAVRQHAGTELTEDEFQHAVTTTLAGGSFRLVVAVDAITPELRTIIEYLNEHTLPSLQVLAIELRYSKDGDIELLTPIVYGNDAAQRKAEASGTKWTEATFNDELRSRATEPEAAFLTKVIEHAKAHGHHLYYGSGSTPGMSGYYSLNGAATSVWSIQLFDGAPLLWLNLSSIRSKGHDALAAWWLDRLDEDPALHQLLASTTSDKTPKLPVAQMVHANSQAVFLDALHGLTTQASNKGPSSDG